MKLINKTILLISPEPWDHIFVSKHHYAIQLAKNGNTVVFLNPPDIKHQVVSSPYKNLRIADYTGFIKGLRYLPKFIRKFILLRKFNLLIKLTNSKFDIIWSFDNSVFFDFDVFPKSILCISHIMDLNQNFQTKNAATSADICFGVIPELVERLDEFNKNSFLIKHGVSSVPNNVEKIELAGKGSIKAMYAGNLDMPHIDWSLFLQAAKKFKLVDFIFIGSNPSSYGNLKKLNFSELPNVYMSDAIPSHGLPKYLNAADILLLAYTPEYYNTYASPHKLMEYFAAGKPIVASYTSDYSKYPTHIFMGKDQQEWLNQFDQVSTNLNDYRNEILIEERIKIAENNTYKKQIERIEKCIFQANKE